MSSETLLPAAIGRGRTQEEAGSRLAGAWGLAGGWISLASPKDDAVLYASLAD